MKLLFSTVFALFTTMFKAFVITKFWLWFIVSQFPTVPRITILAAMGFLYIHGLFIPYTALTSKTWQETKEQVKSQSSAETFKMSIINSAILTVSILFILAAGWVVHSLM